MMCWCTLCASAPDHRALPNRDDGDAAAELALALADNRPLPEITNALVRRWYVAIQCQLRRWRQVSCNQRLTAVKAIPAPVILQCLATANQPRLTIIKQNFW